VTRYLTIQYNERWLPLVDWTRPPAPIVPNDSCKCATPPQSIKYLLPMPRRMMVMRAQGGQQCARGTIAINRNYSFPIGSTQPPQLPPSEVCQRGPHSAPEGKIALRPHRKTFRKADIRCKREPSILRGWKPTFRPPQTGLGAALPHGCKAPLVRLSHRTLL
jgi:hypothetical protein